jgi:diaminobutyrate-2-oxoglutarate transaminase
MMRGIVLPNGALAAKVTAACFERGLIIETSGADDEVVKVLAPLNIDDEIFAQGLDIVEECVANAMNEYAHTSLEVTK